MTGTRTPQLHIRAAGEHDLGAILALYAQPEMDGASTTPERAREVFREIARTPGYTLYVGESDGNVVATFALMIMPNIGHCATPAGVLEDIAVAPACQGQGIGRALVAEAMRLCALAGCYKLTLSSNMRRAAAHAFYERLGFERHGYSLRIDIPQRG